MIITCPSCKKKFKIDANLIPSEGRNLKCGSCGHVWFFKNNKNPEMITENFTEINTNNFSNEKIEQTTSKKHKSKNNDKALVKYENTQNFSFINLFSYFLVSIISFIALIIVLDTFRSPLINVFPNLELFLYNLFETLKDISLFIGDLL